MAIVTIIVETSDTPLQRDVAAAAVLAADTLRGTNSVATCVPPAIDLTQVTTEAEVDGEIVTFQFGDGQQP